MSRGRTPTAGSFEAAAAVRAGRIGVRSVEGSGGGMGVLVGTAIVKRRKVGEVEKAASSMATTSSPSLVCSPFSF